MYIHAYIFFDEKLNGSAYFSGLDVDDGSGFLVLLTAWLRRLSSGFHRGDSMVAERDKN